MKTERNSKEEFIGDFKIASDLTPAAALEALRKLKREEAQARHEMQINNIQVKLEDEIADIKKAEAEKYLEAYKKSNDDAQMLEQQAIEEVNEEMAELIADFDARKAAYENAAADIQYILNEDGALTPGEKSRLNAAQAALAESRADAEATKEDFHQMIEDNYEMPEVPVAEIIKLIEEYVEVRGNKFPVLFREEAKVGELLETEEDGYDSSIAAESKAKSALTAVEKDIKETVSKLEKEGAPEAEITALKKQLEVARDKREAEHQKFLKVSKEFRRNIHQLKAAVSRAKEAVLEVRNHLKSLEKKITEAVSRAEFADFKGDGEGEQATAMEVYDKMADVWSEAGLPDNPFERPEYDAWKSANVSMNTAQDDDKNQYISSDTAIQKAFADDKAASISLHSLEKEKEAMVESIAEKTQRIKDANDKSVDTDAQILSLEEKIVKANERVASIIAEIEATEQSDFEIGGSKAEWAEGQVPSAEDIKAAYDKYFDKRTKESNELTEDISEDNSHLVFLRDKKSELDSNIADMETEKADYEERVSQLNGSGDDSIAQAEVMKKESSTKIQELSDIATQRAEKATQLLEADKAEKEAVKAVSTADALFSDLPLFAVEPVKKVVDMRKIEAFANHGGPLSLANG